MSDPVELSKYEQGRDNAEDILTRLLTLRMAYRTLMSPQETFEQLCLGVREYSHPTLVGLLCFALERLADE